MFLYFVPYIEKATASAADLWDPRNGCLDACPFACLVTGLAQIWVAFRMPLVTCGITWDGLGKLVRAFGLDWVSQATQVSYLALLCRREHRFGEICWILGPES